MLPGIALKVSVLVGSTELCGHTNFVIGLKLGCDNREKGDYQKQEEIELWQGQWVRHVIEVGTAHIQMCVNNLRYGDGTSLYMQLV